MNKDLCYLDGKPIYENDDAFILRILLYFIGFIIVMNFILRIIGVGIVQVKGHSMDPTLQNHEILFGYQSKEKDLKRGDIIIFDTDNVNPRPDGSDGYIKRIIGMPGDTISYNGKNLLVNGKVYHVKGLNDQSVKDNQAQALTLQDKNLKKWDLKSLSTRKFNDLGNSYYWNMNSINTVKVPKNSYFVMGDNRKISNDSREFGYVPYNKIKYKIIKENLF